MNDIKISIIIPVYNGENFIESSIESIKKQTYKNYELIIINDGSSDNTKNILEKYNKDKNIFVYNNANHGVSYSRNFGIDKAVGDYIMFVDADDVLIEYALEILVEYIKQYDVDIIRFNGFIQQKNGSISTIPMNISNYALLNSTTDKDSIIKVLNYPGESLRCYSPLLIIKNQDIISFNTELTYLEDKVFYLENMLKNNKNILFVKDQLYIYNYNDNSKTKDITKFYQNILDVVTAGQTIKKIIFKCNPNIKYCDTAIAVLIAYRFKYLARNVKYKQFRKMMLKISDEKEIYNLFHMKQFNIGIKGKIMLFLIKNKLFITFYLISKIK